MTTNANASALAASPYPDGTIVTVAGTGTAGYVADGGPAAGTNLNYPRGVVVDSAGNLYICDQNNHRVRKVSPNGIITTVAGNGTAGFVSDGGPALGTPLNTPLGLAVDGARNLYIADYGNHRVRKVTPNGIITTVAGNGQAGFVSDGGPAVATKLSSPHGVAVDAAGNLYIADYGNHRVRKVTPNGIITTVAGNGQAGFVSDGGPAIATKLNGPTGVAVDAAGNLYIGEWSGQRVRKVDTNGIITTVAGNGVAGYISDGGPAVATRLYTPGSVAVDAAGSLYIADYSNQRVRKVDADGIITTVAGDGVAGYVADGGPAVGTRLYGPIGVAVDTAGSLYIADHSNHRVRKVYGAATVVPPTPPAADLYGEVVHPVSVPRGQEFDLGARIRSRGPATVDGGDVTVVLTLAEGLLGGPGTSGRRLTRTFTGAQLFPNAGSLDGVFRVTAPNGLIPGTYESTLEIQYGGELNLKDNTYTLPVSIVVPAPVGDETALTIYQETVPEAAPGQSARVDLRFLSPTSRPVNPGVVIQRYTAPTGFVFTGKPVYAYHTTSHGVISGDLDFQVIDGGRTLIIAANPHLNTTPTDTGSFVYSIPLLALPGSAPGLRTDGSATIGKRQPVQIAAKVTSASAESARVEQLQRDRAKVRRGQQWVYPAVFKVTNTGQSRIGTQQIVLTAPEGLRFTENRLVMTRQDDAPRETVNVAERSADSRTLTVRASALELDPGKTATLYPELEVDPAAPLGVVSVGFQLGSPAFASGAAAVTVEA
ncbi:NHL repeat-containing protein [Streptomyces olivoreticuli]|uniref:NHL repeat-containing protein n=1 Tax=Streptomyces olivoreticuli TaxID=68246 RepID=UPI00265AEEAC|nr:NHL repeat-containing protein [Streptomyces olivoreticuli]WKK22294.1 NHL repeat-containing protein [Streptomyces olivoreticuli]